MIVALVDDNVPAWIVPVALKLFKPVKLVIVAFVALKVPALIVPVAVIVLMFGT